MKVKMILAAVVLAASSSSCMGITDKAVNLASDIAMDAMWQVSDSIDDKVDELFLPTTLEEGEFTQTYDIRDFTGIEAGGIFHIIYTQDNTYSVKISSNYDVLKKIKVFKKDDELKLDIEKGRLSNQDTHNLFINVYISAPTLKKLDLSGVSAFHCGSLRTNDKLEIETSGASKLVVGTVNCRSLEMEVSGAIKATGNFAVEQDVEWECSGASKVDVEVSARKIFISNSGACKMKAKVSCQELVAHNSGASKLTLSGTADKTDFHNSGVSHIVTTDLNKF